MNWTLYVSGLPKVICNQCLRKIYAPYGTVQVAHMVTQPTTRHRIGLGVVQLEFPAEVGNTEAALKQGRLAGYTIEAYVRDHTQ